MNQNVIFFVQPDSLDFDFNLFSLLLEKETQYRVFNFFSIEETVLYKNLNPDIIIHSQEVFNIELLFGNDIKSIRLPQENFDKEKRKESILELVIAIKEKVEMYSEATSLTSYS